MSEKRSHEEVNYREGTKAEHCQICKHYVQGLPPHCTGVVDPIRAGGNCDRFLRKSE